jgi:hypothetical protein
MLAVSCTTTEEQMASNGFKKWKYMKSRKKRIRVFSRYWRMTWQGVVVNNRISCRCCFRVRQPKNKSLQDENIRKIGRKNEWAACERGRYAPSLYSFKSLDERVLVRVDVSTAWAAQKGRFKTRRDVHISNSHTIWNYNLLKSRPELLIAVTSLNYTGDLPTENWDFPAQAMDLRECRHQGLRKWAKRNFSNFRTSRSQPSRQGKSGL